MHYYKRHIGDYSKDTGHLSMLEHGAYTLLLDRCYSSEKPIPDHLCERIANARTSGEKKAVRSVLEQFFEFADGAWNHDRVNQELAKAADKSRKASESAKARWINDEAMRTHSERSADAEQTQCYPLATIHYPIASSQKPQQEQEQKQKKGQELSARKRASPIKPEDVTEQTWLDWLALRKQKKAPVTETVIKGAISEARKAGMTLEAFFAEWCTRGSQGLKAEWIKTNGSKPGESLADMCKRNGEGFAEYMAEQDARNENH